MNRGAQRGWRRRETGDEIWVLAAGVWRMAAERRAGKHGGELALCETTGAAQRTAGLRSHTGRGVESERHQGSGSAVARRMVDGSSVGCSDGKTGIDGGSAANVSSAGAVGQTGGKHRPHQQWAAVVERGVVVVGG